MSSVGDRGFHSVGHRSGLVSSHSVGLGGGVSLDQQWLCHLGRVSYSAYLTHLFVFRGLSKLPWARWDNVGGLYGLITILGLFLTLLISSATYTLIEKPCIDWGNRLLKAR